MKKHLLYKIMAVVALGGVFTSCEDTLDVNDTTKLSDAAIWSTLDAADGFITASYKIFTDDSQLKNSRKKFWDTYSDLIKSSSWGDYGHPYNNFLLNGLTSGSNGAGPFECWSDQYVRIRTANVCLSRLREYGSKFGADECLKREAEIRLCRAYSYFMLARVYGGVVLRTETSGSNGGLSDGAYPQDIDMARASEAETYDYILNELQFAAENLPEKVSAQWPKERATQPFAYALISRVALYAKKYDVAAKAAEKCGEYTQVALDPKFENIVSANMGNSPEVLFAIYYLAGNANLYHLWDNYVSPRGDRALNNGGAYGEHQPTAELADLYEWKDGTPFDWNTWSQGHADPFTDREPRFQATILYNGAQWRDRTIETFEDGADGFKEFAVVGSTDGKTCTGYFLRKFLQEDNVKFLEGDNKSITPDLVCRYAEVLLNQAEAYANLDLIANQSKICDCINKIRTRVGLPEKTPADFNNLENAMKIIREERAKELAAEGFRFWDLRRWGLARTTLHGKAMHGVLVKGSAGNFTYEKIEVDAGKTRVYNQNYDYFSIPLAERTNNKLCTNNPGW
ncbi:MAG: RagB/SusD family nutrient uptake outer membrane protein [Muribaculaceae bacterium]|nr:RagB/SusD family nutrient uptake outer membrane protein [Muribaculaceae bacterium]